MIARTLPHSRDTEVAVIVSSLCSDAIEEAVHLRPDELYAREHEAIWEAVLAVRASGRTPDMLTVPEWLRRTKHDGVALSSYLFEIAASLPKSFRTEEHVREIKALAQQRTLITLLQTLAEQGYDTGASARAYIERVEASVFGAVGEAHHEDGPQRMDPSSIVQEIRDVANGKRGPEGISTGLGALDAFIGGMYPGDLIVVAGRPGMGKSSLGLGMARSAALVTKRPTAFFSLEMQRKKCERRYLSMVGGIDGNAIKKARLSPEDWRRIGLAAAEMDSIPLLIDAQPGISIPSLRSRCRRVASKHGDGKLGAVVIDYLQLMRSGSKHESREQEVAEISRDLKEIAKELECPVVALAQLNRKCEETPDKRPQLSHLRESGAIEQDADAVIFVYRRGYYAALMAQGEGEEETRFRRKSVIKPGEDDGKAELIVAKQRDGSPGTVRCLYEGPFTRFVDEPSRGNAEKTGHATP